MLGDINSVRRIDEKERRNTRQDYGSSELL